MAVVNGNPVEASYTNSKLASKTADNTLQGKQTLANGDIVSGATIANAQRYINEIAAASGVSGEGDAGVNNYSSNNVVVDGQNRKQAIEALDGALGTITTDITQLQGDLAAEVALQASNHSAQGVLISALQSDVVNLSYKKYLVNFGDVSDPGTTFDMELFSLPAKGVIREVIISHNTQFAGTGLTALKANVGLSGNLKKYSDDYDAALASGDGVYQKVQIFDYPSKSGTTSVRISVESVGCNLDDLTQGQLEIHVLWTTLI